MKSFKSFILIFFSLLAENSIAYTPKEGNVTATLGPTFYTTRFDEPDTGVKSPWMGGVSLIANGDYSDKESLELGMHHMRKRFYLEDSGKFLGEETELIAITMGYRRWLTSYISMEAGIYSSYSMGEPKIVHNDFPTGTELRTSARDITEYGAEFSAQVELWSQDRIATLFEAKYSLSLTSKPGERADHYGFLLGLKYFVQGKEKNPEPFNNPAP